MNADYIARALCFHGQPMQKIWEDERGAGDLQKWGVPAHPNYAIYQERQKHFTFQDRAKRLKLHQFFARKACDLYDKNLNSFVVGSKKDSDDDDKLINAKSPMGVLPPYEVFISNKQLEPSKRWYHTLEAIKPGDIIYGMVTKRVYVNMMTVLTVKPLCTSEPLVRYLGDMPTKAYVHQSCMGTLPLDKQGKPRAYAINDYVCCEVLEISVHADRMQLGMEGALTKQKHARLGLINQDDLPAYYRITNEESYDKYEDYLLNMKELLNPNLDLLFEMNSLNVNDTFTLMNSLKQPFPTEQYARELRLAQASKWAFRAVAEGIEHFKIGNHVEAFQCLNKALNIDPRNVEGLVARGALYANKGSFLKAVEDFEKALKLNAYHVNARKYMGETLVALGRSYEEDNRIQEAVKAYRDCLNIIPNHEQARLSLEVIQQRPGGQLYDVFSISGASESDVKRRKQSASSTPTADGSSTDSNSDSDTDGSDGPRNNSNNKDASLSPLSKRMAMHQAVLESQDVNYAYNKNNHAVKDNSFLEAVAKDPNEFKLDDDDTESRVRKLLQEASKHKKEKVKKSKKKKSKKSKKESRKQKEAAAALLSKIDFEEAYKVFSGLGIENKLNENLQIYERTIAQLKKRQEVLQQSTSAAAPPPAPSTSTATTMASSMSAEKREETPPPKAPSMKLPDSYYSSKPATTASSGSSSTNRSSSYALSSNTTTSNSRNAAVAQQPKLSFQIRKPVKVDKFGLVRIATPLITALKSPSRSPRRYSRSRTRSRSHSRSRRRDRRVRKRHRSRSWSRHRSRSYSRSPRRRTRSRSRLGSRSRSHSRSRHTQRRQPRSRSRGNGRRRTPSPFVPRDASPRHRRRRDSRTRSPVAQRNRQTFGNRVWQRPGYEPKLTAPNEQRSSVDRWLHDKYDDGPSIEEIDEIINRAQKERKQEIISRDKDILKKPTTGNF